MADGQIVSLSNAPRQSLTVDLTVDGKSLTLRLEVVFSEIGGYWVMTISDQNGNLLLDSIPLVTGSWPAANLLGQYAYLGIGSCYVINQSGTSQDSPDADSLGSDFVLVWDSTAI